MNKPLFTFKDFPITYKELLLAKSIVMNDIHYINFVPDCVYTNASSIVNLANQLKIEF